MVVKLGPVDSSSLLRPLEFVGFFTITHFLDVLQSMMSSS